MKINVLIKFLILSIAIMFFASCDKDYNEIGSDIVGDGHYLFDKYTDATVLAYNQNTGVVQTNNLPLNSIGHYNHPIFGKTTASFVTQIELASENPKFYDIPNIEIDSVYLYVPYFSDLESTDNDTGDKTYSLDSIYNPENKIKLSVYENGYYLRDYDASTQLQEEQKYFSNQFNDFDNAKIGSRLNDGHISQNDEFVFKDSEIKLTYIDEEGDQVVKERKTPGMWMDLNIDYFRNKIFNAPSGKLLNNNIFKDYFKGLFFKVEAIDQANSCLGMLNFSKGTITIVYQDETSATVSTRKRKTMTLNLTGNTVNLFQNNYNSSYLNSINSSNLALGDERLFIKGQEGSMAIVELFGNQDTNNNGISDEIDQIKANNWLINEANLTFYIDRSAMASPEVEPLRVYLYDIQNRRPLTDYADGTSTSNEKLGKYIHGGIIETDEDETNPKGIKYKIRITNHIRNIIKNDSTNVKLGLVVTENINVVSNGKLKNPVDTRLDRVPTHAVIHPFGTVLYGNNNTNNNIPEDKKLKLEIFYTKPD